MSAAPMKPAFGPSSACDDHRLRRGGRDRSATARTPARVGPIRQLTGLGETAADDDAAGVESGGHAGQADPEPAADVGEQLDRERVAVAGGLGDLGPLEAGRVAARRARAGGGPSATTSAPARGRRGPARCPRRTAPSSHGCRTRTSGRRARPACGRTPPPCRWRRGRPGCRARGRRRCRCPASRRARTGARGRRRTGTRPAPAVLASLSTTTGSRIRSATRARSGSRRQLRCGENITTVRVTSTKPAAPMPTAATSYC